LEDYRRLRSLRFQEAIKNRDQLRKPKKLTKRRMTDDEAEASAPDVRKRTRSTDPFVGAKIERLEFDEASRVERESAVGIEPRFAFDFEKDPSLLDAYKGHEMPYKDLRAFMLSRPRWDAYLRKHFSLLSKENQMSRVLLAAVLNLTAEHKINGSGLIRKPNVTSFANSDLRLFILASDGVVRWYERDKPAYDRVILENRHDAKTMVLKMMDRMAWLRDDRTCIVVKLDGD